MRPVAGALYGRVATQHGAISDPRVQFPAIYKVGDNMVCGVRALEDIQPYEAFLYIPNKLIISAEHAKQSELAPIFKNHDSLFVSNPYREYFTVLIFVLWEKLKGEDSFWHPYFEAVGELDDLPMHWSASQDWEKFDDQVLRANFKESLALHQKDWESVMKIVKLYEDDYFPVEPTFEQFKWVTNMVSSRCFGHGLPTTMITPLADMCNHSH